MTTHDWPRDVFDAMGARGIATVATVPDGGLTRLLESCEADPKSCTDTLTTEEEGVGVTSRLSLAG